MWAESLWGLDTCYQELDKSDGLKSLPMFTMNDYSPMHRLRKLRVDVHKHV